MGYRSEVVLAVSKDVMPYFLNVLAKEPEARTLIFKDHNTLNEDYDGEGTLLVAWSDIKWYESHGPIKAINNFVEECEADMIDGFEVEYQGDHVRFVRIGEEYDDHESRGSLHGWDIGITRSLLY
tara:strand:+ start:341 stop:715 length:375 start_codon:yes stop_codon:yes gene_type:complete